MRIGAQAFISVLIFSALAFTSCIHFGDDTEVEISAKPVKTTLPPTAAEKLVAFEKVLAKKGDSAKHVQDIHAMLRAKNFEAEDNYDEAVKAWFNSLKTAKGRFGRLAFQGWIKAYAKKIGNKSDRGMFARLILAETQNGAYSPYMTKKKLVEEKTIIPKLVKIVPNFLYPSDDAIIKKVASPLEPGIPKDDPLLVKTVRLCADANMKGAYQWKAWEKTLSPNVKKYWKALLSQQLGNGAAAREGYLEIYTKLATNRKTVPLALEAASRLARLQRSSGQRTEVAETYADIVTLWYAKAVTHKSMGLAPAKFVKRKINETLWAARYRAYAGDLERGKQYAKKALAQIAAAYANQPHVTSAFKKDLAELKAEAHHILAFRIAVERYEYNSAIALARVALEIPDLSDEWRDRFLWYGGLYEYLAKNYDGARKNWETLLAETKEDSKKAQAYFWLSRVYLRLGQTEESEFYQEALVEDYPLNFYSVVASRRAGFDEPENWASIFGTPDELAEKLRDRKDYNLSDLRKNSKLERLLKRAEIIISSGLNEWGRLATRELDYSMRREIPVESNIDAYVYLSRLYYASRAYLNSIALTTELAGEERGFWKEWPDQLLIYFPKPYSDIYERKSIENTIDEKLLLSISRQESGFRPDIKSPAGAIGVMQLMPATAKRFASEIGIETDNIKRTLLKPEANISIGSRYLKFLSIHYKRNLPAIYGSYNAGEQTMDMWLIRRSHKDPLAFVELVPFGETKGYIRNVWRNMVIYNYLESKGEKLAELEFLK